MGGSHKIVGEGGYTLGSRKYAIYTYSLVPSILNFNAYEKHSRVM